MAAAIDWVAVSAIATAVLAVATFAFVIAAFLQRQDARDAAQAATRAAAATEEGIELQRQMYAEQSRLATYPPLVFEFFVRGEAAYVRLGNAGAVPAVNVDLAVLAVIWESDTMDLATFVRENVRPDQRQGSEAVGTTDDGSFGVSDHLIYDAVPPRRQVEAPLMAPSSKLIVALIQYRDMLGRNYRYVPFLFQSGDRYSASGDEETEVVQKERVDLFASFSDEAPVATPQDAESGLIEFLDLWTHRIPAGFLIGGSVQTEDRGTWSPLA